MCTAMGLASIRIDRANGCIEYGLNRRKARQPRRHLALAVYAELFFDPQAHTLRGVAFDTVIRGIRSYRFSIESGYSSPGSPYASITRSPNFRYGPTRLGLEYPISEITGRSSATVMCSGPVSGVSTSADPAMIAARPRSPLCPSAL